jgi:histidyl-tRNA synthetase
MQPQALPGFRDFYPADLALRAHVIDAWRRVALRYGFEEYDGPPLEPLDLYTAKSGDEIVGQLYEFEDKGGRRVALRPEMTPTLARMVAARAGGLKKPIRWFSIPQLFRYERQQRGRLREHFQFNCDLIGESSPLADAEIVALALDVMRDLGLGPDDVRVRLSDRRVMTALLLDAGVPDELLNTAFQAVDKIARAPRDRLETRLAEAGLGSEAVAGVFRVAELRGWPAVEGALAEVPGGPAAGVDLAGALEALETMGLGEFVDVDLSIVRGLAYYTGMVFELFDAAGEMRAICGGGRYDQLLGSLGGVDLPALGFGMGDVVLSDVLQTRGLFPEPKGSVDVFVVAVTPEDVSEAVGLSHTLRDRGVRVEYSMNAASVGKQLKLANARQARFAVVIGPEERKAGQVVLRDLATGDQRAVALEQIPEELVRAGGVTR